VTRHHCHASYRLILRRLRLTHLTQFFQRSAPLHIVSIVSGDESGVEKPSQLQRQSDALIAYPSQAHIYKLIYIRIPAAKRCRLYIDCVFPSQAEEFPEPFGGAPTSSVVMQDMVSVATAVVVMLLLLMLVMIMVVPVVLVLMCY